MATPVNNNGETNNDILERCLRAVERGQVTIDDCVRRFPEFKELGDLLRLATTMREMPRPQMSAAFTARTQQQLQAQLRAQAGSRPSVAARRPWLLRFILAVGMIAILLTLGGVGLVRASGSAVPGDSLYGVKRTVERTELLFASSGARPGVLLHIARTRLEEIPILAARKQTIDEPVLIDMAESVSIAILEQPDPATRTQLAAESAKVLQQAEQDGAISQEVADRTLGRLPIANTPTAPQNSSVTNTATPLAVVQSSLTSTATSTATQTAQPTSTPTASATTTPHASAVVMSATSTHTSTTTATIRASATSTYTPTATATATATASQVGVPLQPPGTAKPGTNPQVTVNGAVVVTNQPGTATATSEAISTGVATVAATEAVTEAATAIATELVTEAATQATATDQNTAVGTEPATLEATEPATNEFTATLTASNTLIFTVTRTPTATRTNTATRRPTRTPTSTRTRTPTPTATPIPTSTPTPVPTQTPAPAPLQPPPQDGLFNNCLPEGQGGDPATNRLANRVDEGNYQSAPIEALQGLTWPKEIEHKSRDQWSQSSQDEVAKNEGQAVAVEGYLAQVQQSGPEAANCNSNSDVNTQLWLVNSPDAKGDLSKALIAQITPRVRANHAGWTNDRLTAALNAGLRVRVSGWLLINVDHPEDVGKSRATIWEIRPVMQIAVQKDGQWIRLEDYQP